MFLLCFFVCLFISRITQKLYTQRISTKSWWIRGMPIRCPLDFGSNPDHVMLELALEYG